MDRIAFIRDLISRIDIESTNPIIPYDQEIKYHFENFIITSCTFSDQTMITASRVLDLGIPSKSINLKVLLENEHSKESKLVKLAKKLDK